MKVLMVATSYPRFSGDSAAVFLRHLARATAQGGHDVQVLAPNDPQADDSVRDERVTVKRFEYVPGEGRRLAYGSGILPNLRASRWMYLQIPLFLVALFVSLFGMARRIRPDVIHAHWIVPTGLIAVVVGKLLGIPVVTTAHGGDAFSLQAPVLRWLKKITLQKSTAWTSNTHSTAAAAMNGLSVKVPDIVPMGVDVPLFASGNRRQQRYGLQERDLVVLFVGRLVEKKGCNVLIEAFNEVVTGSRTKVILRIAGEGDDREALERLVGELGLTGLVQFLGRRPNEDLPDIYAGADLFVLPSIEDSKGDTEGQGVVLLEAMAAGVPIVASQVGGVEEVIEDGVTGWLVKPRDPRLLGDRIIECLNSPKLRSGVARRARHHVASYDWPVVAERFVELYKTVSL